MQGCIARLFVSFRQGNKWRPRSSCNVAVCTYYMSGTAAIQYSAILLHICSSIASNSARQGTCLANIVPYRLHFKPAKRIDIGVTAFDLSIFLYTWCSVRKVAADRLQLNVMAQLNPLTALAFILDLGSFDVIWSDLWCYALWMVWARSGRFSKLKMRSRRPSLSRCIYAVT